MTSYEWSIEYWDADGDIIDLDFADTLKEVLQGVDLTADGISLCLVWDDGFLKGWAYVVDGNLETGFRDAYGAKRHQVPARFHQELERCKRSNSDLLRVRRTDW